MARAAPAWRTVLVRDSCTTRYAARAAGAGAREVRRGLQTDVQAGRPYAVDEGLQVVEAGLRSQSGGRPRGGTAPTAIADPADDPIAGKVAGTVVWIAQYVDERAQIVHRVLPDPLRRREGGAGLVRRVVEGLARHPQLHTHHGQGVRHDVVQLPRDLEPGLGDPTTGLGVLFPRGAQHARVDLGAPAAPVAVGGGDGEDQRKPQGLGPRGREHRPGGRARGRFPGGGEAQLDEADADRPGQARPAGRTWPVGGRQGEVGRCDGPHPADVGEAELRKTITACTPSSRTAIGHRRRTRRSRPSWRASGSAPPGSSRPSSSAVPAHTAITVTADTAQSAPVTRADGASTAARGRPGGVVVVVGSAVMR